jgi:AcrR family transcriptional regulator
VRQSWCKSENSCLLSDVSRISGVRQAQKQQTRQALLDAGLRLLEKQSLSSVGLREVTREAGITPTAFYRHFSGIAELGTALVEESFGSLRAMVAALRAGQFDSDVVIDRTVDVIVRHVREHRPHFRFVVRERYGGVREVRAAIAGAYQQFIDDLASDLTPRLVPEGWSAGDIRMLAGLYVEQAVGTVAAVLDAEGDAGLEGEAVQVARKQLKLIRKGREHWVEG